jgi:hypothetical protein
MPNILGTKKPLESGQALLAVVWVSTHPQNGPAELQVEACEVSQDAAQTRIHVTNPLANDYGTNQASEGQGKNREYPVPVSRLISRK